MTSNVLTMLCRHMRFVNMLFLKRSVNSPALNLPNRDRSRTSTNTLLSRFCSVISEDRFMINEIDSNWITGGDPVIENELKKLILEIDLLRQDNCRIPDKIHNKHWKNMLQMSKSKKKFYLLHLFKMEKTVQNVKKKKEAKRVQREEVFNSNPKVLEDYGMFKNSMFVRILPSTISNIYISRLLYHSLFAQPLVIDCSYENEMTERENGHAASQMTLFYSSNRENKDPFDIHLCNIPTNSIVMNLMKGMISTMDKPWFPMHLHYKHYLDVFPNERLVYLTPDCENDLIEYDHDAVYIIGCLVDTGVIKPHSMTKAIKENIKMAKLPLDRYLDWGSGAKKTLTLNQVVDIMLEKKAGASWEEAFKHIPRRKLANVQLEANIKKLKKMYTDN